MAWSDKKRADLFPFFGRMASFLKKFPFCGLQVTLPFIGRASGQLPNSLFDWVPVFLEEQYFIAKQGYHKIDIRAFHNAVDASFAIGPDHRILPYMKPWVLVSNARTDFFPFAAHNK